MPDPGVALLRFLPRIVAFAVIAPLAAPLQAAQRELVDLSLEELSEVKITSVSRRVQSLDAVASAVQVITAEEIRRSGATRLPEALRLASNLQVAQINSNSYAVSARGFNGVLANKLLVMIDGRTVYSPLFAGTFWDSIDLPLFDVDRIEVISGPGGALWGANAVNGVINIITRDARATQGLKLRAGAGDEVNALAVARFGGVVGEHAHYRVYGKYWDRDAVQRSEGGDGFDDSDLAQAGFRLDWRASQTDAFTLQGDVNEASTGQQLLADVEARSRNLLARWSRGLSDSSSLQVQTYYDYAYRSSPGLYSDRLETFDVELQHDFKPADAHHLVWGLTYRRIEDDFTNMLYRFSPEDASLDRIGGFVEDEIELTPDELFLTIGTKYEDNEYTGPEWQPSVSLGWRYSPGELLWTRASRAVRTPSRFDRSLDNPTTPPFTVGSDAFDSETVTALEAGWKTELPRGVQTSLAVYYNDYDELRSFERLNPSAPIPVVISNRLEGESHGLELTADYRINPRARVWFGYTWIDVDLELEPGSTDPSSGATEARDWEHQGFLRGSLDVGASWELYAELRRIGGIDSHRLPPYTELDVSATWRLTPTLELLLVGRNLLDSAHGEIGPPGRLMIERAIYAQFTWTPTL